MKYEAPEVVALTPAINAIQTTKVTPIHPLDSNNQNEVGVGYEDWE